MATTDQADNCCSAEEATDDPGYVNESVLMSLHPGDTFCVRRGSEVTTEDLKEALTEMRIRRQRVIKRRKTSAVDLDNDMVYLTVKEIVTTERSYVTRLNLLNEVSSRNMVTKAVSEEVIRKILPNLSSIWDFHRHYLLPRLEERLSNWTNNGKIGDLFRQSQPFLRQYSDYMVGLKDAQKLLTEWTKKSSKFAAIIADIEKKTECDNLKLETHMLEPIQRLPRYQLLLERYVKYLPDTSPDVDDAKAAVGMIKRVADYADEVLFKTDNHKSTLNAYRKIRGELSDSVRKRILVKEGVASYLDGNREAFVQGYIFLFTDVLLMCVESTKNKYILQDELFIKDLEVKMGTGSKKNDFLIITKDNAFQFSDRLPDGKIAGWYQDIKKLIDKANQKKLERKLEDFSSPILEEDVDTFNRLPQIFLGEWAPRELSEEVTESCLSCHRSFEASLSSKMQCVTCSLVICEACSRVRQVTYKEGSMCSVCIECDCVLAAKQSDTLLVRC